MDVSFNEKLCKWLADGTGITGCSGLGGAGSNLGAKHTLWCRDEVDVPKVERAQ